MRLIQLGWVGLDRVGEPGGANGAEEEDDDDDDGKDPNYCFNFANLVGFGRVREDGEPGGANGAEEEDDDVDDGKYL